MRLGKPKLPAVVQAPEPRPVEGVVEEVRPRLSPEARAEIEARRTAEYPAPPERKPDGERTIFRAPKGVASIPVHVGQTDYPDDSPQPVQLSEASRAAIEHARESERPQDPPREDGTLTIFKPAPGTPDRPLGYAPDDREDGKVTTTRPLDMRPTAERDNG